MATKRTTGKPEIELRRWCIEQALRWPMEGPGGYAHGIASGGGGFKTEANIIDRAERIRKWVVQR